MIEKVTIMHDPSVYRALEKQARFNRKIKIFVILAGAWILHEQLKKRNEDGSPYFSVSLTKNMQNQKGE